MVLDKAPEPEPEVNETPADDNSTLEDSTETEETDVTVDETEEVDEDPASPDESPPDLPHKWMSGMTAEQRADEELVAAMSKFPKGIPDLVKAYRELESNSSQPGLPSDNATEEELAAYYESRGVPKTPEDYELSTVEMPEDSALEIDEETEKMFLSWFHDLHLSTAEVNGLREKYYPYLADSLADAALVCKTTEDEAIKELHKTMKPDEVKETLAYMGRAYEKYKKPGVDGLFERTGIGNDPGVILMFSDIGKAIGESLFIRAEDRGGLDEQTFGNRSNAQLADNIYGKKSS